MLESPAEAILRRVVSLLEAAGIPFMIVGSFASSVHGKPRTTQDLDIVIHVDRKQVEAFIGSLSKDEWYADLDAARDAVLRRSINLIDMSSGWKVDLVVRKDRAFSVEEFSRWTTMEALGVSVPLATAEDTIIAKLEWSKTSGGSERQRRDVQSILEAKADLDRTYLARWIKELALEDEWLAVQNQPSK
jgi:hypothetical protein